MLTTNKINPRFWSRLGQRGTFFGIAIPELAKKYDSLWVITADVAQLSGLDRYSKLYPERWLNVGIAEQNMIGIAAGLAMGGNNVFATTYASFVPIRCLEQIRQNVAYQNTNVKLIGSSAGVLSGFSGISHWATEDIACTRTLPNMIVTSPADSTEAYKIAEFAANYTGPMYIRLSGALNCPIIYHEDYDFTIGKGVVVKSGTDIAIITTGLMVNESLNAASILEKHGISTTVVNIHTIKPLDTDLLKKIFAIHNLIVTVEEHNVIGGLGSAVSEYKATLPLTTPRQVFIGITSFGKTGSQQYIWEQQGLTAPQIAETIESELKSV